MSDKGRAVVGIARRLVTAGCLAVALWSSSGTAAARQPPPRAAQEGFVPVDETKPQEQLPAAPLVMAAYAVAWVAIFAYVWSLWSRLSKVEREIAEVSRRIDAGSRR